VYVLCVSRLRGSGARNGRYATQKRTSAGLHNEPRTGKRNIERDRVRACRGPRRAFFCAMGWKSCARGVQIRRTVSCEDVLRPLEPGGPCITPAVARRASAIDA
jgi:hypothetical protein